MKIYFTRHGESQANLLHLISNRALPHGLTSAGRDQAACLAEYLHGRSIARIYTSPVLRAVETARIIAGRLQVEYEPVEGLREFDCGIAEGRGDEAAWQLWKAEFDAWTINQDYDYQIEGGESFIEVRQRFVSFVDGLIKAHTAPDTGVVCISHGGIYSVVFPWIMHNVNPAMVMKYGFGYTSLIIAEYKAAGLVCVEWNGTPITQVNP